MPELVSAETQVYSRARASKRPVARRRRAAADSAAPKCVGASFKKSLERVAVRPSLERVAVQSRASSREGHTKKRRILVGTPDHFALAALAASARTPTRSRFLVCVGGATCVCTLLVTTVRFKSPFSDIRRLRSNVARVDVSTAGSPEHAPFVTLERAATHSVLNPLIKTPSEESSRSIPVSFRRCGPKTAVGPQARQCSKESTTAWKVSRASLRALARPRQSRSQRPVTACASLRRSSRLRAHATVHALREKRSALRDACASATCSRCCSRSSSRCASCKAHCSRRSRSSRNSARSRSAVRSRSSRSRAAASSRLRCASCSQRRRRADSSAASRAACSRATSSNSSF